MKQLVKVQLNEEIGMIVDKMTVKIRDKDIVMKKIEMTEGDSIEEMTDQIFHIIQVNLDPGITATVHIMTETDAVVIVTISLHETAIGHSRGIDTTQT